MKKTVQVLTAIFCLLFLLAGLGRTLLSPDTEIAYENRPANRLPAFSASAFLRGEFQDGFEDALADQIPMAIRMKKLYNIFDTGAALPVIRALGQDGGYVGFRDICFYHDMLVVRSCPLPERESAAMRESGRLISDRAEASPETEFYVYYIETDRDRNFETETPGMSQDCALTALRTIAVSSSKPTTTGTRRAPGRGMRKSAGCSAWNRCRLRGVTVFPPVTSAPAPRAWKACPSRILRSISTTFRT